MSNTVKSQITARPVTLRNIVRSPGSQRSQGEEHTQLLACETHSDSPAGWTASPVDADSCPRGLVSQES